jgi:hypothetical protein
LKNYIEENAFTTLVLDGVIYKIYGNGRITLENGDILCVTGGESCLNTYLESIVY